MFQKIKSYLVPVAGAVGLAVSGAASAAIDITSVTTSIGEASAPIAAIGAAVLVVIVGTRVYKWIQRAL